MIKDNEEGIKIKRVEIVNAEGMSATRQFPSEKNNQRPLFTSHVIDSIEKDRLSILVAAFQFWDQQHLREMLNGIMDKSSF